MYDKVKPGMVNYETISSIRFDNCNNPIFLKPLNNKYRINVGLNKMSFL